MKRVIAAAALLTLAGCGFDWFPAQSGTFTNNSSATFTNASSATGNASRPAAFTFTPVSLTTAQIASDPSSTSNTVTLSGPSSASWTLTMTDSTASIDSELQINGGYSARAGDGTFPPLTVHPGDTIAVRQNSVSSTIGGTATTTVTVGTFTTQFITTTIK